MRKKMARRVGLALGVAAITLGLALPATAAQTTLGTTTQPTGSTADTCGTGAVIAQLTSDPTTQYMVPPGGGLITSWSINVAGDTPGDQIEFVVLRPTGGENYTVVGTDTETIPNPLPAGNVATYPLTTPITVTGGETLGLYSTTGNDTCYWFGGDTPTGDSLQALVTSSPPTTGESLSNDGDVSPTGFTMDLSATLGPNVQDAGVSTSAGPSAAAAHRPAVLSSTITNGGPGDSATTFTDQVPAGLTIDATSAGSGTCSSSGQTVTCSVSVLAGQSAAVNILVTPAAAGTYTNHVSVQPSFGTDPNSSNNSASATLAVQAGPVPAKCTVPSLRGTPIHVARHLLRLLGCRIGKIRHVHSQSVKKWRVIRTSPKPGTYARGKRIGIRVSSGRKGA